MSLKYIENGIVTISLSDIVKHPLYEQYKDNPKGVDAILHTMGFDINDKDRSETYCTHRNTNNEIVTCDMFSAKERKDENWKKIKNFISQKEFI